MVGPKPNTVVYMVAAKFDYLLVSVLFWLLKPIARLIFPRENLCSNKAMFGVVN